MIEEVIATLITPLTTLLTNANLLTAMGGVSQIGLYDTDLPTTTATTDLLNCYVRLYDSGNVTEPPPFLGGAKRFYSEIRELIVEYSAYGSTARELNQRIDYLRMAVETQIRATLTGATIQLTDVTGSASYVKVQQHQIAPMAYPPNSGPNKDPLVPQWKRPGYSKVRIIIGRDI